MEKFQKYFIIIISFLLVVLSSERIYSQTDEEIRALWIYNIAYGVSWEDESNISKYTIGVFSSDDEFKALKKLAASKTIKNKPFEVIKYSNYEDIKPNHIVYVTKNENAYLGFVYNKLKGKNVLIISDRSRQPEYSVINLKKPDEGKQFFDINSQLYNTQKLKFTTQLLRSGGDRKILNEIYAETNAKLLEMQNNLEQKELEIKKKEKLLKEQEMKLKEQELLLKEQEKLIKEQEELLKNK
ncbi:MAG: YfiR family protein [Bacteroidales bacterium]|nr:YfiR family protein [Bacteroidales bacterium]